MSIRSGHRIEGVSDRGLQAISRPGFASPNQLLLRTITHRSPEWNGWREVVPQS